MAENDLYAPFSAPPQLPPGMLDALLGMAQTQRDAPQRSLPPTSAPAPPAATSLARKGMLWPISYDEKGVPSFDSDAGLLGSLKDTARMFGEAAAGQFDATDPANTSRVLEGTLNLAAGPPRAAGAAVLGSGIPLGRARDPALWHGLSLTKLPRPVSEMHRGRLMTEPLQPERLISPEALEGGVLLPAVGDRSATGGFVTHSGGGQRLEKPVPLQGGHGFMKENAPSGQIWASDKPIISTMANRAQKIAEKEQAPVYLPYTAMSERSVDFSHHVSDVLADQLKTAQVPKKALAEFDKTMRELWNGFKPRTDWPGAASKDLDEYLVKAPGAVRNKFAQLMASAKMQNAGFPSVAEARFAVTDPRLLDVPTGAAGLSIGRIDPSVVGPSSHRTYDTGIGGTYEGSLGRSVPKEVIYPDIVAAYLKQGYKPEQIDYLMQKGTPPAYQKADAKWLEGMMKYDEAIRRGE